MNDFQPMDFESAIVTHGFNCPKVEHTGDGYLHGRHHDGPYDVDGVKYCGRCHGWMGT